MKTFNYKAVDRRGSVSEGRVEAADRSLATLHVQRLGLIPLSVEEPRQKRRRARILQIRRITRKDLLFFTQELATLMQAGLPLDRSLTITARLAPKDELRALTRNILQEIERGKSLAEALGGYPKYFNRLYVNMVRAGETGGVLVPILNRLLEFQQAADELRTYLISALLYPALLVGVGITSISILLFYVVPRFVPIFQDAGAALPFAIQLLVAVSNSLTRFWYGIPLTAVSAVLAFRAWRTSASGSRTWDSWRLSAPLLGPVLLKIEVAQFARTLGTLISSAVPLIGAVRIVEQISGNQVFSEAVAKIATGAKKGEGVARPMRDASVFPDLVIHLVEVGEETGRLDTMLLQVAQVYEKDVRTSVKNLTSVFEPALILVMGLIVGTVVLSMLMAIFSINEIGM